MNKLFCEERLVEEPADTFCVSARAGRVDGQWREVLDPGVQRDKVDLDSTLREQLLEIPLRQPEAQIPADRQQDQIGREPVAREGRSSDFHRVAAATGSHANTLIPPSPASQGNRVPGVLEDFLQPLPLLGDMSIIAFAIAVKFRSARMGGGSTSLGRTNTIGDHIPGPIRYRLKSPRDRYPNSGPTSPKPTLHTLNGVVARDLDIRHSSLEGTEDDRRPA
jgi:hypothetical protein